MAFRKSDKHISSPPLYWVSWRHYALKQQELHTRRRRKAERDKSVNKCKPEIKKWKSFIENRRKTDKQHKLVYFVVEAFATVAARNAKYKENRRGKIKKICHMWRKFIFTLEQIYLLSFQPLRIVERRNTCLESLFKLNVCLIYFKSLIHASG